MPGIVLVDERTRRRTDHAIRYGPTRGYRAKGKLKPIPASEAIGVRSCCLPAGPPQGSPEASSTGNVSSKHSGGRSERGGQARSSVLVVTAEPGAGKTRWRRSLAGAARALLLSGRCAAYGQRLPLFPIASALQDLIGLSEETPEAVTDRA